MTMDNNTILSPPHKNKYRPVIFIILVFMIYYLIMMTIAPARRLHSLRNDYGFRQDEKSIINDSILTDSSWLALNRERSCLLARTEMAETDSIYLSMNLADSSVSLGIAGVTVSSSSIIRLKMSSLFRDRNSYHVSSLLSKPLTIEKDYSSIPREPLMIKMAPKDTSEYKPDIIPDTADYEAVNFILEMKEGLTVFVYQEERLKPGDGLHMFFFDMGYRFRTLLRSLRCVFVLKVPEYRPFIKVRLPRSDAKRIYRALPENGQVAVCR
jgi:hypothetical protein